MIEYRTGNLLGEDVEALVNTVNCVGVMGRGVALQFKKAFPANFAAYAQACRRGEVQPGRMFVYEMDGLTNPRFIINFPTKRHWRGKSRMEDIEYGLLALIEEIRRRGIRSIAIPPLGSGLGGLHWPEVRSRIERAVAAVPDVRTVVYEPGATDEERKATPSLVPAMTPGRAALVVLMNRYLAGLLDPFVTLLEVHKLMYFLQEAGEPLKLRFAKAPYGPYAENLRHVLSAIEGHLVTGYSDGGDSPTKQLNLLPGAVGEAERFLTGNTASIERLERVGCLVEGFETPVGLELLATVHWVATRESASREEIASRTYEWGARKKQFSERQLHLAYDMLHTKGWLDKAA
jgi:O-acetyl-ADP-ribose deacetylase (regulator of RNase III)